MVMPGVAEGLFGYGPVDESANIISKLFQHKDMKLLQMTTEIDPSMVYEISVLMTVQERFSSRVLGMFAKNFFCSKVSQDRKGRTELGELQSRRLMGGEEEE